MVTLFQPDFFLVVAAAEAAAAGGAGDVHHRALRRFGARRGLGSVPRQHAVAARHHVSDLKTFAQVVGSTRVPKSID